MKKTLWTRDYTLLMAATTLGCIGGIAGNFALSFFVFDKTGSTLASALVMAVGLIPRFVIPTFAAPFMDRLPRKPFLVAGDAINGFLYTLAGLYLLKHAFSYPLYLVFSLILASMGSFDSLAYNSIYPNMIPEGMEQKGYAVSSILYPVLNVLMMPIAAVLMDTIGVAWILIGQGVLSMLASFVESFIRIEEHNRMEGERFSFSLWKKDFLDGLAFVKSEKGLQALYGYMAVSNGVATGYGPLLIAFFRTTPGLTSAMYAMFSVAEFAGRSIGALFNYHVTIPNKKKFGFSFFVYQFYDLMDIILLWLPYPMMLLNRGFCGFLGVNSATLREAAVQKYIPDEYRARLNAFCEVMITAACSVFSVVVGALGDLLDYRVCVTLCALLPLIVSWAVIWRRRQYVRLIYEGEPSSTDEQKLEA